MTAFHELAGIARFAPFDGPPPDEQGTWSPFTASWGSTVELLVDELRHLDASQVIIELDLEERHLRLDGMPRSDARVQHDGVRLSFTSKWGPLRYETAEFSAASYRGQQAGWQQNLRAVALAMEALRKVDRYGVSKRGEQYRGWRALPMHATDPADLIDTRAKAEILLAEYGGVRQAIRKTHPDAGGDPNEFRKVMRAKSLVEA